MTIPIRIFKAGRFALPLGGRTLVMGIVNVTPDSFSDGGESYSVDSAVSKALSQIEAGADIIDIGGESTRPGSIPVSLEDELSRIIPVIEALAHRIIIPISIDTYKSDVALQAIRAGASIVNDISAGSFSPAMPKVIAESDVGVVLMHIKGTPRNMQKDPHYENVVDEVLEYLKLAERSFLNSGVASDHIIVDPGIGFGKSLEHNLKIIRNLYRFQDVGTGVVYGPSRKSFIGLLTGQPIKDRLAGTLGSVIAGTFLGADIVRVHDVRETVETLKVADAIRLIDGSVDENTFR